MNASALTARMHISRHSRAARGFTFVEVLIVVLILGILAALVVPQFSNAADEARESSMRNDLRYLRTQIMVYRAQHNGVSPGHPGGNTSNEPTFEAFVDQMTRYSSIGGSTADAPSETHRFGPYLQKMPTNPINNSAAIRFIAAGETFPTSPEGDEGWVYQPSTGQIAANVSGVDKDGVAYFDY